MGDPRDLGCLAVSFTRPDLQREASWREVSCSGKSFHLTGTSCPRLVFVHFPQPCLAILVPPGSGCCQMIWEKVSGAKDFRVLIRVRW